MENNSKLKMEKFNHLMLDIETMGTDPYSSITCIAAVEFNIQTGETGKEFIRYISLQSCFNVGLKAGADTIMWWLEQNEQARLDLIKNEKIDISQALLDFSEFCNNDYEVWGNSPRFDCGLLKDAYTKCNLPICWNFRKERDLRTLVSLKPDIKKNYIFTGTSHNALCDCYNQIGYCVETWKNICTQ